MTLLIPGARQASSTRGASCVYPSVNDRVELREQDLFGADVRPATVVTLFLWPEVNLKLRPKLLAELRSGTRIVPYMHDMGDWAPQRTVTVAGGRHVYLWIAPGRGAAAPRAHRADRASPAR